MTGERMTLADAKRKLDVAVLWRALGLPGEPGKSCRCPLHEDKSASFSVFISQKGALRWKCHANCGQGGPVELLARVLDIDEREACRRLLEMAGGSVHIYTDLPARQTPKAKPPPPRRLLLPVGMYQGNDADLRAVATRRRLSFAGVELATARGLLWFASPRGCPSWIVTDQARTNAQARQMDGGLWAHIGGVKAWTLPGSRAPWPIGAHEAAEFPMVLLVEGAPDLLAAHHFITKEGRQADTAALAMLGSANHIPPEALSLFAGKRVRIYPHADAAGRVAAIRWAEQLERVGCEVDAFRFDGLVRADGKPVKDLNDFALLHPNCLEAERDELAEVIPR